MDSHTLGWFVLIVLISTTWSSLVLLWSTLLALSLWHLYLTLQWYWHLHCRLKCDPCMWLVYTHRLSDLIITATCLANSNWQLTWIWNSISKTLEDLLNIQVYLILVTTIILWLAVVLFPGILKMRKRWQASKTGIWCWSHLVWYLLMSQFWTSTQLLKVPLLGLGQIFGNNFWNNRQVLAEVE